MAIKAARPEARIIASFAGAVSNLPDLDVETRVGGFGGIEGLVEYLAGNSVNLVIDATHPFAAQMSRNAAAACGQVGVPLVALTRAAWEAGAGDNWLHVPDIAGAVSALDRPPARVLLAVGRMHLADFAPNPQHHYLLRLVDPPAQPLPFPDAAVIVDRGPFDAEADTRLLQEHRIDIVVSKNSGGNGAVAKIAAARAIGLPVIMIDRPAMPPRDEVNGVPSALEWLAGHGVDLGGVDLGV